MKKLLTVLGFCLFLAACGSESSQQDDPSGQDPSGEASSSEAQQDLIGTYALDKSAFEDALMERTLEGEKMDSLLAEASEDEREAYIERTKNSLERNVHDLNWTLDLNQDGSFKLVTNTGSVVHKDSSLGTWSLENDSLLMLTTNTQNDSALAQPATRRAIYKDGDILIEDDRMASGLVMRMEKM